MLQVFVNFPVLPYIQKPEENPSFSLYFTRAWQDSVLVSLHNLLATVFQCMPQPTLTSYESDAALVKRLQDEIMTLKGKVSLMLIILNYFFSLSNFIKKLFRMNILTLNFLKELVFIYWLYLTCIYLQNEPGSI